MANLENAAGVGLAILIISQIPQFYQTLMPYPCDIEKEVPDGPRARALRKSEIVVTGMSVAMGFGGSLITQTPWPFLASLVVAGMMTFHYESSIRFDPTGIYE